MQVKVWWVYLLACKGGRTYAGIAIDVGARFLAHREGKGAKFTRANKPLKILGAQSFPSRSEALKAEYALKQLERPDKLLWARERVWLRVQKEEERVATKQSRNRTGGARKTVGS